MRSYSVSMVTAVRLAHGPDEDKADIGPKLGLLCVANNISVMDAATTLGVSRHTVYRWFTGRGTVSRHLLNRVEAYYDSLPRPAVTGS